MSPAVTDDTTTPLADSDSTSAYVLTPRVTRALAPWKGTDRVRSWIVVATVACIGAALRLIGLSHPKGLIFDEVYYAQDAHQLLQHGVEWDIETEVGSYVAHPPLGKWCIALGEWLFGYNEFGWRISSVVAGVVTIILITLLARRITGSTILGGAAGLLMSIDGLHLVLSRTALLDIFLTLFIVAAMYCVILDRESRRKRWLTALEGGLDPRKERPRFAIPWWRFAAGATIGLAMGVKWSALWFILLIIVLLFVWEWQTRRVIGVARPFRDTLIDEVGWIFGFGLTSVVTYLSTWTGWFLSDRGSFRHWLLEHGESEPPFYGALYNLWQYHKDVLEFHEQLSTEHTYQSWPWQWLLDARPVAFFWSSDVPCDGERCASEVLLLGTPLLWWCFIPAMIALLWWACSKRDWRAWTILATISAGIGPWLFYPERTMFFFYALPAEPFLIMAVVFVFGMIIGPAAASSERRLVGSLICAGLFVLIMLCFAYFWPIYTGQPMLYDDWHQRMWLDSHWV